MSPNGHSPDTLDALRRYDTCTLANAIERFNVRPRNEGFMSGGAWCRFPRLPAMVGYWEHVDRAPRPRILVLQDFDHHPGFGAFFGEVHARISRALTDSPGFDVETLRATLQQSAERQRCA